jgi:AcrR family transcriptional regulator
MENGPRRHKRKAATRAALLEAGRRLIEERGAEATQVGDIARASGVAHGTFYVHFASKDALLDELWLELDAELGARLRPIVDKDVQRDERQLTAIAAACLDHWLEHRGLLRALAERAAARADLRVGRDGFSPTLASLFAELGHCASRGQTEADLLAQGLVGMWMRIGMLYALGAGAAEAPTREQALHLLTYSLACVSQPLLQKAS